MSPKTTEVVESNQKSFDQHYITSAEIMKFLNISRAGFLYGRRAGKLPEPIVLNDGRLLVWKREEVVEQLQVWKLAIAARK